MTGVQTCALPICFPVTIGIDSEKMIYDAHFSEPCAIVMGNEETGISKEVMHHADEKIKLPITGKTQSLNVSVACGAIPYEAVRQKMVGEL